MKILYYWVAESESNILGSGCTYSREKITTSEEEAFKLLDDRRDDLRRKIKLDDGRIVTDWWDTLEKTWKKGDY